MDFNTKGFFCRAILPFIVMVLMEGGTIALTILAKTIITGGLSPYIFVVYTSAVSTLILIPYSIFYHWSERIEQSLFTFPVILRVFLLGFTGVTLSQNLAFVGLDYSSPIMVCAMGLLFPSFSFLLSVILRRTKLEWSSSFQIKVIGTIVSVTGACMAVLYLGPAVQKSEAHLLWNASKYFVYLSTTNYWAIGGILLAAATFLIAVWNVIQVGAAKEYPQVMKLAAFYSFMGTIQTSIFALFMERDLSAWKLSLNWELKLVIMTALFNGLIRPRVHIWCTKMHGPTYVPLFQPFRIMWASYFGSTYFAKTIHYGSIAASCIGGVGFYTIMWGNIRGDEKPKQHDIERVDSDQKVPLLQGEEAEV